MARWQQIEVLTQGRQVITESWKHDLKRHYWRCYLNLDAGAQLIVGQQTIRSDPGSFYLIPPYQDIRSDCSGAVRHNFFHFMLSSEGGSRVAMPKEPVLAVPITGSLSTTAQVWQDSDPDDPLCLLLGQQVISAIIIAYLQENPSAKDEWFEAQKPPPLVQQAIHVIEESHHLQCTNASIAAALDCSPDYLGKIFKKHQKQNLADFIRRYRIQQAAQALLASDNSIETIAEHTGFTNRYHFSRVFHRVLGRSPAAYRKAGRI